MSISQKTKTKAPAATSNQKAHSNKAGVLASPSRVGALFQYFEDAKKELGKVSWPTRKEIKSTGLAVLAMIVVMSIFLGVTDLILTKIIAAILSLGA